MDGRDARGCSIASRGGQGEEAWFRLDPVTDDPLRVLAPGTIRFCPLCAGTLGRAPVPPDLREQAVCVACGFVFYLNPKVVAGWTYPGPGAGRSTHFHLLKAAQ